MWDIDNATPYAAAANWIRDKQGAHLWLVAVKATYDLTAEGEAVASESQPEPVLAPLFRGDPSSSSLLLDSDLLSRKPGTDVLLNACAYAPGGRPTGIVEVSLFVGSIHKRLLVYGPRVYRSGGAGLASSSPQPFTTQPIEYEWAFGGSDLSSPDPAKRRMDARNPVGRGVVANTRNLYDTPAHVIEYPGGHADGPAGFGPIASSWSPRRERAGTYDDAWERSKKPLLPDDYDDRCAMSAPDDQQCTSSLSGGELLVTTNLCTEGVQQFELPRVTLSFETMFGTRMIAHSGRLSAVLVSPHLRKLSMVWQTVLRVAARDSEYLDFTLITEEG